MEDIKDRLAHILRAKNLTAKQFAELMGIQPSNVSHLLNGRNKPSLEFLTKLKEIFPEYSFDWIIMGKKPITINEPNPTPTDNPEIRIEEVEEKRIVEFDDNNEKKNQVESQEVVENTKEIEKIIVVYTDKTFEILNQRNIN